MAIYTRNNNRCDRQYPELQVLPHYIKAKQAILDGEIVIMDDRGVSHFELIQPRIHLQDANAIAKMAQKNPAHLFVFDLLYLDGRDLRSEPLIERKRLLQKIVKPFSLLRVSESFDGSGDELLEAARQTGLEGMIAKRANSIYESRRSANWLKVKLTSEQEFVIEVTRPVSANPSDRWRSAISKTENCTMWVTSGQASTDGIWRNSGRFCSH